MSEAVLIDYMAEGIEDYCLNRAMDEARETPLFDHEAAMTFLHKCESHLTTDENME